MSEQVPNSGKGELENRVPDTLTASTLCKSPTTGFFSGIGITQLTLVVLVVVFLWQWLDGHRIISDMQQQLAKKIAEMDVSSKANQLLLAQSQDQVRELYSKVAMLEARNAEVQSQRGALDNLYSDLSVTRDETLLAEIEQMLLNATQQLQLSANVRAALIALQSADARLQRINQPSFAGLRETIGEDMDKLRTLPSVDINGINLQLNKLISAVDELPLAYQRHAESEPIAQAAPTRETASDETVSQKLLREIWQEAKRLVRIENTGMDEIPLLQPNQEFFLRENLKLRLLSARIALLSRDEKLFRQELKITLQWTARYFDSKSPAGSGMLAGLKKISASNISIELPDLNSSLQAVHNYRLRRDKPVR
ncbi:MAG: uroporphyrinogen-III C-methyltransferase [Gallionella sp.]